MLALHPARDIGPADFAIGKAALTRLEHLDVVRRGESSGAEERQKVVEAQRGILRALVGGRQCPRVYFHVVGRNRIEGADGDRHDVADHEIGEDTQVAAGLADALRPLRAEAFVEPSPHFLEVRFAMLAEWRYPVRDRASPRALVLDDRVTVAEIDGLLVRRRGEIAAFHVNADVSEKAEISLMRRHSV